jgi:hypothetical protein
MKTYTLLFCVLFAVITNAQTGIGTSTPHASAKLHVSATDKGFLPPRISLTGMLDVTTIPSPATGLVIYNTVAAGVTPNNVVPGYYYWDGTKWNGLVDQGALNAFSGFIPNYAQSNASSVTRSSVGDIVVSQSITTSGRPIQIIATGDANPLASGAWVQLQLFRDGTAIGKKIQAESSSSNENVPYCLNFIDNPTAGTYTYSVRITAIGGGSFLFGEADGNQLTLLELGAWSAGTMPLSRGGTGSTNFSNGSVLFSDGSRIAEKNTQFFWDNTNNRLGIGTTSPSVPLDVNGAVNANTLSLSNVATGTSSLILRNGDAATTFGDNPQIRMGWSGSPTGTNQYAQIIHTRHNAGPTNNAIDFYLSDGTASNTITNGSTRAMTITSPGDVEITGKLTIGNPTGNVATKLTGRVTAGTFLTFDNLRFSVTTAEPRGLSIATVSGTVNLYVEGRYNNGGVFGNRTDTALTYSTSPSGSLFGWGFNRAGDTIVYQFIDPDNSRMYRVTLIIMPSYINNFISIERLL